MKLKTPLLLIDGVFLYFYFRVNKLIFIPKMIICIIVTD